MADYLFTPPETKHIPVQGRDAVYPVNRIFCVGRNYAAHAAEMGNEVDREAPFYFTKSPAHVVQSGATMPFPPGTQNLHHEMELVIALGSAAFRVPVEGAHKHIFGYGCGLDMTRRDLQDKAKSKRRPWDVSKDFEQAAVLAPLMPADTVSEIGSRRIHLAVNGETRQEAHLSDLVWSLDEIISDLSHYYHLVPGDVIMTGTPAGVGAVVPGDVLTGSIDAVGKISLTMAEAER